MDTDPFHVLGIEPGCDFAAITAAHSYRCQTDPANKDRYDRALLELLGAGAATPGAIAEAVADDPTPAETEAHASGSYFAGPAVAEAVPAKPVRGEDGIVADVPDTLVTSPRQPSRRSEADVFFRRGAALRQQGDFEGALEAFSAALRADPGHVPALANRGRLLGEHFNNPTQALRDFNALIRRAPQSAEAYFLRGKLKAVRLNQAEQAAADFTRAIELKPDWAEAYYQRGLLKEAAAELKKALADYSQTVELDSQHGPAFARRARIYEQLGDRRRALLDYDQAIRLQPNSPELYLQRGWLLQNSNRPHDAFADYNRAIEVAPHVAQAYYSRGKLFAALGQPEKAQRDFEYAIELDRQSSEARG